MKTNIYILLGSNLGDREQYLVEAINRIRNTGCLIIRTSSIYRTAPWGKTNQPDFLNQVICISTELTAEKLLTTLLEIEAGLGRVRHDKWGERAIDLDILFFDHQVISNETLTIPHPGIALRRFTLVPLCEIAPQFIHPVLMETCATLLEKCTDFSPVEKYIS